MALIFQNTSIKEAQEELEDCHYVSEVEKVRLQQIEALRKGLAIIGNNPPTKLHADLLYVFGDYDSELDLIGIKSIKKGSLASHHDGTFKYPAEGLVECSTFDGDTGCGNGMHFSFAHSRDSIISTMNGYQDVRDYRYQIALISTEDAVIVQRNKIKCGTAQVVFTGSFEDCKRLLNPLFATNL